MRTCKRDRAIGKGEKKKQRLTLSKKSGFYVSRMTRVSFTKKGGVSRSVFHEGEKIYLLGEKKRCSLKPGKGQ